jgi:adenylate cyclase
VDAESSDRRLAAILSADVVGYSRLMAEDEVGTIQTIHAYREAIRSLVEQHRGRVVDAPGDNLLAEFPSALDAVQCAVETQAVLRVRNQSLVENRRMLFRIGVHLGDIAVRGDGVYGDGVNLAARLEGLAEPGGVCISGTVHEQVEAKLDLRWVDLGEQSVKNIRQPVRAYRFVPGIAPSEVSRLPRSGWKVLRMGGLAAAALVGAVAAGAWLSWPAPLGLALDLAGASRPPVNPSLPDVPSIVVLPFTNISGDPEQEYFSDGVTEELTTVLSRNPLLFVSSRNSAFTYKGKPMNVAEVGRELGVRYVLEGSVRKAEGRVRITAQLIDATTNFHLWSESYDRELADIFALQSEISEEILAALQVEINEAELERIRDKPTENLNAYDLLLRGTFHFFRVTREDNARARSLGERVIELDPNYADAYALLAWTYLTEYGMAWSFDQEVISRGAELAHRALELNPSSFPTHLVLSRVHTFRGRRADAIAAAERAVELNPNSEGAFMILAVAQLEDGRYAAALQSLARALRLNPRGPGISLMLAYVNAGVGRRQEAVESWERVRADNPDMILARIPLAIHYESGDRPDEARTAVQEMLRVNPDLTAELAFDALPGKDRGVFDPEGGAQEIENLRRAGLP